MPSLAGERAWAVSDQLEAGSYHAKPASQASIERVPSSNGNPQVMVDWKVQAGPFTGAQQKDWITFTDASLGRVVQVLEACGIDTPETEFESYEKMADWLADTLRQKMPIVEMVIRLKPGRKDPTREFPEVAGYRQPSASDIPSDASGFRSPPGVANGTAADDPPFLWEPVPEYIDVKAHANRPL